MSKDTIYRQDAIDAVSDACFELRGVFGRCEDALKALPSAQPKRKKGKWGEHGECPFCDYLRQWGDDKFCANCGADMRGDLS